MKKSKTRLILYKNSMNQVSNYKTIAMIKTSQKKRIIAPDLKGSAMIKIRP